VEEEDNALTICTSSTSSTGPTLPTLDIEQSQRYQQEDDHQRLVQMRRKLPTVARECDRWGISDRSAAAITSAVLYCKT